LLQIDSQLKIFLIRLVINKKLILFLSFVLVLLLAWFLGKIVTQNLVSYSSQVSQVKSEELDVVIARGHHSYLFGKPEKTVVNVEKKLKVKAENVEKTRLNITLVGIIDMGKKSLALIKKDNKTLVVFEGDEIMPRVVLLEVYPEEIVINNQGVQERLSLIRGKNKLLTKGKSKKAAQKFEKKEPLSQEENSNLNEIGRALKKSPVSIAKFIKFKPINKNGRWAGVKIWSKADKKLFGAVGFEEGDLLIDVNGRSINELASNPRLWQEFLKESQFKLIVERNGQEYNISVDLSGS